MNRLQTGLKVVKGGSFQLVISCVLGHISILWQDNRPIKVPPTPPAPRGRISFQYLAFPASRIPGSPLIGSRISCRFLNRISCRFLKRISWRLAICYAGVPGGIRCSCESLPPSRRLSPDCPCSSSRSVSARPNPLNALVPCVRSHPACDNQTSLGVSDGSCQ